jgi:glutamate synthase (NADPH/NADH) large chain
MASSQQSVIAGIPSQNIAKGTGRPGAIGLYDPSNEKDACGVGFIVDLSSKQTRETVNNAITMLEVCVSIIVLAIFSPRCLLLVSRTA